MTNREFFNQFLSTYPDASEEMIAHVQHELEQLDKRKASRSSALAKKKAEENAPIVAEILEVLNDGKEMTATEIGKVIGQTFQKVGSLCRKMVDDGKMNMVKRKVPKKGEQTFFFVPKTEEVADTEEIFIE